MARQDVRERTFSGITTVDCRHRQLPAGTLAVVVVLDFSGKHRDVTLAASFEAFLSELAHVERLRPATVRAYSYELAAAAADVRLAVPLDEVCREDLDAWLTRAPAASSTVGRRVATFRRFFVWATRNGLCRTNPMAERSPLRGRRRLPRPIREQHEQRALDAAIGAAPQPYRLIFTILRETGMRVGEALELGCGDVTLDRGREALRVRQAKNGVERAVVLGPTATPHTLRNCVRHGVPTVTYPRTTSCCFVPIAARASHTTRCTTNGPSCARRLGSSMPAAFPATHRTSCVIRAAAI